METGIDWTGDGVGNPVKMSASKELLTGVLKQKIGFDGFLISDWEAIHDRRYAGTIGSAPHRAVARRAVAVPPRGRQPRPRAPGDIMDRWAMRGRCGSICGSGPCAC
ncbi:MAG: glycoside hydrolase family 3 N-terminal domain-containing protein [Spirillospora sp.]